MVINLNYNADKLAKRIMERQSIDKLGINEACRLQTLRTLISSKAEFLP